MTFPIPPGWIDPHDWTPLNPGTSMNVTLPPSGDTTGATDTGNLQAAVAPLIARGGVLQFQPGRYYISQMKLYSSVEYWGSVTSPLTGSPGTVITAPFGSAVDMVVPNGQITHAGMRYLALDGGNGTNSTVLVQPNQFNGLNLNVKVSRCVFEDLEIMNMPGDGVQTAPGNSYAGTMFYGLRIHTPYGHGMNLQGSDIHLHDCEVYPPGLSCFYIQAVTVQGTLLKSNFGGARGVVGDTYGIALLGNGNVISGGVFCQNDIGSFPASANGNAIYISGSRNYINAECAGASNALLELDGAAVYNTVEIQCSNVFATTAPNYVYQVNNSTVQNNRVRINGNPTTLTAYALLAGGGTELNNDFQLEQELYGSQSVNFAATITPDPYKGGTVKVGTLTGAITINNPANGHAGSKMTLELTQDGTGGHAVTFGGNYKVSAAIPTTLSTTTVITFLCDSTSGIWHEVSRATA